MRVGLVLIGAVLLGACGNPPPSKFLEPGDPPNVQCEASNVCATWGWCGKKGDECVAVSDQACRASRACKVSGLCSFKDNRCVAKDSDDCSDSQYCKENGLCSESEGVCK